MKSKNKVSTCIYVVLLLAFVCYLFLANSIILSFNEGVGSVERIRFSSIKSNQTPRVAIDTLDYLGGTTEDFYIAGWGFCETDYDNTDKKIGIVFKKTNSDTAYIFDDSVNSRPDVYNAFKDTTRIKSEKADYKCSFSTLKMQPGLYELYISVVENEHDFGIVTVNRFFKKSADGMIEVDHDGSPLEVENTTIEKTDITLVGSDPMGRGHIDTLEYDDNMILVSGWATLSTETNRTQKVFIGVTYPDGHTDYYNTLKDVRSDLVGEFGDDSYSSCGYKATILVGELPGDVTISLVTGVDNKYYPIKTSGKNVIQTTVYDDMYVQDETVVGQGYIDSAQTEGDNLVISGWATYSEETNLSQVVIVSVTDETGETKYYSTTVNNRPDLITAFDSDTYSNCGFNATIPIADIKGNIEIGIVINIDGKYYDVVTHGVTSVQIG